MSELNELLSKIGLNNNQLKAYKAVVAFGFHTAGQIASKTSMTFEESLDAVEGLVEKNYLKKKQTNTEESSLYFPMAPKIAISADLSQSLSDRLKSLSHQISEIWQSAETKIDQDTRQLIDEIQTMLTEYASKIDQLSTNNQGSIDTWSENTTHTLKETTNDSINEFKESVTQPLSEIATSLGELSQKIQTQSSASMSEIESKTDAHQASIELAVESIKNELGEFAEEVGFILSGRISGLNQMIENTSSDATQRSEEITNGIRQDYQTFKKSEEDKFTNINEGYIQDTIDGYGLKTNEIDSKNNELASKFNDLIDQTVSANDDIKGRTISSSEQFLDEFNKDHASSVDDLQNQFNQAINTVQENAVSQLGGILSGTSGKLSEMKIEIGSNLNQYQHDLSGNLSELTSDVESTFNTRFAEIQELLGQFVANLKKSTRSNVSETTLSIVEMKDFLTNFLDDVQNNLDQQLNDLSQGVNSALADIVSNSSESIDKSVAGNQSRLQEINSTLNSNLTDFQNSVNDFLRNAKADLQSRLENAQTQFKEGVEKGVEAYESESKRIRELQSEQMTAIKDEAKALSAEAEKARANALQSVNTGLNEIKNTSLNQLNDRVNSDVEKLEREMSRYNDRLSRELQRFNEDFHDSTQKLRDDVPQSIENMFLNQSNQLEGVRRNFENNRRFIKEFFSFVISEMEPGEKNWKRKEFQNDFYQRVKRIRDDFDRFESEFERYFNFALEDSDEVKNELLSNIHRTMQDELRSLDELVDEQGSKANTITEEFVQSLDAQKSQISDDMKSSINDTISELTSEIRKTLLTKFEQPLESIIGKAQAVATGTEGVDQENRIIKAQNLLISKIDEAVDNLVESLQQAFNDSVQDLDAKVEQSIAQSNEIVSGLQTNISDAFQSQTKTVDNFAEDVKGELKSVEGSVSDQLQSTIDRTKSNVGQTFQQKTSEVESNISNKTAELEGATNSQLQDVDDSLTEFNSNLDRIQGDTIEQVQTMVTSSINDQKQSLDATMGNLDTATSDAKNAISATQSSLDENVGATLSQIEDDVSNLVNRYRQGLDQVRTNLVSNIDQFYQDEAATKELIVLKEEMSNTVQTYLSSIREIQQSLEKHLRSKLANLSESHSTHLQTFSSDLQAKISELAENNSNFILDLFDQISTQLSSVQAEVLGSIENAKNNIDNTVTNSVETVRTDILTPANDVVTAVNDSTTQYANQITDLIESFNSMADREDSVIEAARTRLLEKMVAAIDRESQSWKERGQALYGDQSSTLHKLSTDFESKVSSATSEGKEAVSSEIDKIPDVIEDTLDAASKSMHLLNEISKGAIELDPDTPDTSYFDVGPEAIKANMNAILRRTKSSLTMVVPNISWIDPDLIPTLTRSKRIIVDANNISHDDLEIIDKFKEHDVMASLRQLDRNKLRGAGDADMVMASRDKEEVLLAKPFDKDKPYAFVSQDDYFINKFSEFFGIFQTMPEYSG